MIHVWQYWQVVPIFRVLFISFAQRVIYVSLVFFNHNLIYLLLYKSEYTDLIKARDYSAYVHANIVSSEYIPIFKHI